MSSTPHLFHASSQHHLKNSSVKSIGQGRDNYTKHGDNIGDEEKA